MKSCIINTALLWYALPPPFKSLTDAVPKSGISPSDDDESDYFDFVFDGEGDLDFFFLEVLIFFFKPSSFPEPHMFPIFNICNYIHKCVFMNLN